MRKPIDMKKLYQLYVIEKKSGKECAKQFDASYVTIYRRLSEMGWIEPQKRDEYGRFIREGQVLPENELFNHPMFKTGKKTYRKIAQVYRLPEYCYHCQRTNNLHIHHIDGNRENNDPTNLRWVCGSCHIKVEHKDHLLKRDKLGRFC